MYVTIAATKYADCPEYRGAELKVPAVRALVQDAMERELKTITLAMVKQDLRGGSREDMED